MFKAAIAGASGYAGGELLRLLSTHPHIEIGPLFGDSSAGQPLAAVHPHLPTDNGALLERFAVEALDGVDVLFAALPHGQSQRLAASLDARDLRFVDLGADFRLSSAEAYAQWYGASHEATSLIGSFVYGIPEINRERIRGTDRVAAAGCYPTAAILALKPLIDAGLIERSVIVDAASGLSGAGKALRDGSHFNAVAENFTAYGLLDHRHTAEMEEQLAATVLFTPHLAPMNRGILATCYGVAARTMDSDAPLDALKAAYADEPFVRVSDQAPSTKWALGSNTIHLTARYDQRTGRVLAIAALDNLVKGAAGQMIQCANLMLGIDEAAGLPRAGVYP